MTFKKGESGNPHGRPKKGQTITDIIEAKLDKKQFAETLLNLAYLGDLTAIKLVMNYLDGMPVQKVNQEGETRIIVEYAEAALPQADEEDYENGTE